MFFLFFTKRNRKFERIKYDFTALLLALSWKYVHYTLRKFASLHPVNADGNCLRAFFLAEAKRNVLFWQMERVVIKQSINIVKNFFHKYFHKYCFLVMMAVFRLNFVMCRRTNWHQTVSRGNSLKMAHFTIIIRRMQPFTVVLLVWE